MATTPSTTDVVEFPLTGERFRFRSSPADETRLAFDFEVAPGGGVDRAHHHLHQEETFRCRAGTLLVDLDGTEHELGPGEELTIPAGTVHTLTNPGAEETRCDVEYRPAGRNREWFQLIGAYTQKTGREPGLLDLGPFIGDVGIYVSGPPVVAQRALYRVVLKPLGVLLGRRRRMLAYASEVYGRPFTW